MIVSAVLAIAAALVAAWPYAAVIAPGSWMAAVLLVVAAVVLTGAAVRTLLRRRGEGTREIAALLSQLVVAGGVLTWLIARDTALLGIIPTPGTMSLLPRLAAAAWDEVLYGVAPLPPTPALTAVLGAGFAAVALLLDQLIAQRGAVLASLLTAAVGTVPMIITMDGADVVWFVLLALLVIALFRHTATRNPRAPRRSSLAVAAGVAVAAVGATVLVAPMIPVSTSIAMPGAGRGVTVDASLRLGDDLRRPTPVEVLTLATAEDSAPYLRLATLSRFDGRVWVPDDAETQSQREGFGEPEWAADIAVEETRTSILVTRMSSPWLPVPYPATGVQGLADTWRVMPENRTLTSRSADAEGNDYTVTSMRVTPTLEQIRAIDAAEPLDGGTPVALPGVIGRTAREVTADAETDYDRLIALQTWFRSEFSYSLETPVEEGFDGTGAEAVARFLDVRAGYCIHFAGAFALMAETLDMRVRVVVGYLPGTLTAQTRGEESVYSMTSDQLHSWPEVFFPGVGWVPFEPTASLGVPTGFQASAPAGTPTSAPSTSTPVPTATPSPRQTAGAQVDRDDPEAGTAAPLRGLGSLPVVLAVVGAVAVLLLPALLRETVRARRRRARTGDALAAWTEIRDTLLDLGLPVSDAETPPRTRAAALVRTHGVDAVAMGRLTDAVERSSYARVAADAGDLTAPLDEVLARLRTGASRTARLRALLIPRSLITARGSDAPAPA